MKRTFILWLLCISVSSVFAQNIKIDGVIRDGRINKPFELANIILQTQDSLFIKGTSSNEKGHFVLDGLTAGDYRIIVSSIGYTSQTVELPELSSNRSLGEIILEEDAVALEGVTISASNTSSYSDKKLIFPSSRQIAASTNGVNLLQQLMLPKLRVNPLFDEVSLPGGGELQFRINGAKVELNDIKALQPSEIIRVEYHDNPGLRYGNAEVVLDYIVRRPETGGSFGVDLMDALNVPIFGNNSVTAKINHKKSEWSAYYMFQHRDFDEVSRDNEEKFVFPNGSILNRVEEGESGIFKFQWQAMNVAYSYVDGDKRMLRATFRFNHSNEPHMDYTGYLYNVADKNDKVYMIDNSFNRNSRPSLDLYYQENLRNDQTLVFNVVGTYNKTRFKRFYQESRGEDLVTDVNSRVDGKRYSVITEGIYEKKLGVNRIGTGIRHTQSSTDNTYLNGLNQKTEMDQAVTYAYGEFRGKANKLDYTLGIGVTRSWFKQKGDESFEDYTFNPRFSLHYTLPGRSFIRLNGSMNNSNPSLSNMSAVEQAIDSLQIQRGNPNLKPYNKYTLGLTYEVQKGIVYGNFWGQYEYHHKAIMDEKYWEGNKIIQTWDNQKSWQWLAARANLRVGPIKDILQFSATGGVNRYISKGNTYSHTYTNWFTDLSMSATYKKFMLSMGLNTNWNWFYGETLSGGENLHYMLLQYSFKNTSFTLGAFNPFLDNYKSESENWSQYASFQKANYIGESSRMFLFKINYNFSFGRKFNSGHKKLENQDSESGVMNTGK